MNQHKRCKRKGPYRTSTCGHGALVGSTTRGNALDCSEDVVEHLREDRRIRVLAAHFHTEPDDVLQHTAHCCDTVLQA